jgi:putative tricarboxylic transport membrane protein
MRMAMRLAMLVALLLAAYVTATAWRLGVRSDLGPGAGFFPFVLALLLAFPALLWLALDQLAIWRGRAAPQDWPEGPPPRGAAALRLLGLCTVLVLATAVMDDLGFPVTVFVLSAALLLLFEERRPAILLPVALAAGPGLYALFTLALGVDLPAGVFLGHGS